MQTAVLAITYWSTIHRRYHINQHKSCVYALYPISIHQSARIIVCTVIARIDGGCSPSAAIDPLLWLLVLQLKAEQARRYATLSWFCVCHCSLSEPPAKRGSPLNIAKLSINMPHYTSYCLLMPKLSPIRARFPLRFAPVPPIRTTTFPFPHFEGGWKEIDWSGDDASILLYI